VTDVPGSPSASTARAAAVVAFCPSPPLLLPEVEGRAAPETAALRQACDDAVTAMLAWAPEVVVVVGHGAAGERFGPGDAGDLRGYGVDVPAPFAGPVRPDGRSTPLPHTIGARLLDRAGFAGTRVGVDPSDLARVNRDLPEPVGFLVMGDGSARRTVKAPGYLDEAAGPFDAAVARALAAGDPAALAALDPADGERLLAAGVPAWRAVGRLFSGRPVTARLHYDDAPFGVGYLVADWVVA
jgi:hypothetical protein